MGFTDAVASCFRQYATFSGRARRSEYWWWYLFLIIATVVTVLISDVLYAVFAVAVMLPARAVTARRLHDIDRSGWWQLIALVPLVGWVVLIWWLVQPGDAAGNRFGESAA